MKITRWMLWLAYPSYIGLGFLAVYHGLPRWAQLGVVLVAAGCAQLAARHAGEAARWRACHERGQAFIHQLLSVDDRPAGAARPPGDHPL